MRPRALARLVLLSLLVALVVPALVAPPPVLAQASDPAAPLGWELVTFGLPDADGVGNPEVVPITDSTEAKRLAEGLPLEPERLLRMTVREGSWMSVDVSPDGSTVLFDLLGSLWTVPIEGGEATPLTRGMAFDAQPRFSPDGERVVFTSDRSGGENVWMLSLDLADTVRLTRGEHNAYQSPTFSPDGEYVVVTRQGGGGQGKLRMIHVDGGSGVDLIDEPSNLRTTGAAFTPDGEEIWYGRRTGSWTYNSSMRDYQLAVYDRETGETRTETNRYGGAMRPTLSPDGRWLVYATRHVSHTGLRIRDLETGEERGSHTRCSGTSRSPGPAATPTPGWPSPPIPAKWWPPTGGRSGASPWTEAIRCRCPSRLRWSWPWARRWTSTIRWRTRPTSW